MVSSPAQVRFGYAKSETLPRHCRECEFLTDGWAGSPKNRLLGPPGDEPGVNYLCAGLRRFFPHAAPEVQTIAAELGAAPIRSAPRM